MEQLNSYEKKKIIKKKKIKIGKRDIFRNIRLFRKFHNIVVHIRGSALRTKQFKNLIIRMIPLGNRTKWNNWYHIFEIIIKYRNVVDSYTKEHFDIFQTKYYFSKNWEKFRTIYRFLKLFNEIILII
jgi:hypothetical protein